MLAAFDLNILLYSLMEPASVKGTVAQDLIERAGVDGAIVPAQVLGEVLAVVRRRRPDLFGLAVRTVDSFAETFRIAPTDRDLMLGAAAMAERYRLQVWDSVICVAAAKAGATHLLSEDLQDGAMLDGVRVINPFDPANANVVDRLLPAFR